MVFIYESQTEKIYENVVTRLYRMKWAHNSVIQMS